MENDFGTKIKEKEKAFFFSIPIPKAH